MREREREREREPKHQLFKDILLKSIDPLSYDNITIIIHNLINPSIYTKKIHKHIIKPSWSS
jgi:hypothetical protein